VRIDITMAKFTKRAIMLSLLKLLKQKSVDKVTVKDICDECEINRNTFYYYFKSKEELIEPIMEYIMNKSLMEIEEIINIDYRLKIEKGRNIFGNEKNIIRLIEDKNFNSPTEEEKVIIDFVIEKTRKFYWNKFIELVYSTYPIISQEKGSSLNLIELAREYKSIKNKV
jgi:AcrR family transcriptional regulator